ncbi:MAG: hypothetical protein AB7P20_18965 [Rhizobiaceae bacterium]
MNALHIAVGSHAPDRHALESREGQIMMLLAALGIEEIQYSLDGGGDSGDTTLEHVLHAGGRIETRLPDIPIGFHPQGGAYTLDVYLENLVSDLPEGDWVNNEGGYGEVYIRPMADEEDRFECNMTFRDEDDYEDEVDFDEDPDDADKPDAPKSTGEDAEVGEDAR